MPPLSPIVKEANKNDPLETPTKSAKSNDSFSYDDKENPTFLQTSTNRIESTRIEEAFTSTPNTYSNNPLSSKSRMNRPNLDAYDFGSSIRKTNKPNARQSGFDSSSTPKTAFKEIQNKEKSGLAQAKQKKELNKIESSSSNEGINSQAEQLDDADDDEQDDVEYSIVDKNNNNEDYVINKILSEHSYHLPDKKEQKQPKTILKAINESDQEEEERVEKPHKRVRIISLSSDSDTNDEESKANQKPEISISKRSRKIESDEEEEEQKTVTENDDEQMPFEMPVLFDDRDDLESYSNSNQKKERKKSSNTSAENNQSKNTSQKSESNKEKPKDKVKKESAKRASSNVESSNNDTEENDDENDAGLRRSKRHRIGRDSIAIYEFKPMIDNRGNKVMVQELVGTKPKTNFFFGSSDLGTSERLAKSDRQTEAKLTANEFRKYKKEIKTEDKHAKNDEKKRNIQEIEAQSEQSNETNAEVADFVNNEQTKTHGGVEKDEEKDGQESENEKKEDSVNLDEVSIAEITPTQENVTVKDCGNETMNNQQIYCYSKYLNEKYYEVIEFGSEMFAITKQNCIIRINEGATTKTIMHDSRLTLFVQKGACLLWLNGVMTEHKETDVIIVPKCLNYKIKNLSNESKLYIFFQFF